MHPLSWPFPCSMSLDPLQRSVVDSKLLFFLLLLIYLQKFFSPSLLFFKCLLTQLYTRFGFLNPVSELLHSPVPPLTSCMLPIYAWIFSPSTFFPTSGWTVPGLGWRDTWKKQMSLLYLSSLQDYIYLNCGIVQYQGCVSLHTLSH